MLCEVLGHIFLFSQLDQLLFLVWLHVIKAAICNFAGYLYLHVLKSYDVKLTFSTKLNYKSLLLFLYIYFWVDEGGNFEH